MKVRKGDSIIIISGKDRGKTGTILRVFPKQDRVLIDGINVVKRHKRGTRTGQKGQIIERALPIHVSNVAFKDAKSGKGTRIGYKIEEGKKVRIAKATGAKIG